MKTKFIATIATIAFFPIAGFAQPSPPPPPVPPAGPPDRHEKMPKVPVTFLGVETSEVPGVVSEQLGLPKGFGLVVDYVVPDGPAAAAGVQQNDIIKMLNDQILIDPNQLSKLVRSFSEGTTVTLTVLRKGQEQKIPVKLAKKEVHEHDSWLPRHRQGRDWNFNDLGDLGDQMRALKERLGDAQHDVIRDAVTTAHEAARRARDDARRAMDEVRIFGSDGGALKSTKIDIGKAQIVFSDDKGEMKLETVDGKKLLTANDPRGKLLFSGPVETREDVDKLPPEIRQRYEKLQQNHLPAVEPRVDADEDESVDDDEEDEAPPMEQVQRQSVLSRNGIKFLTQGDSAELLNLARLAAPAEFSLLLNVSSSAAKMHLCHDAEESCSRFPVGSAAFEVFAESGYRVSSPRRSFPCRRESTHAIKWACNGAIFFAHSDRCDLFSAPRANIDIVASSIAIS